MLFRKKDRNKNTGIEVGVSITPCKECEKNSVGAILYNMLSWIRPATAAIAFDRKSKEIIVDKRLLMQMIQLVNPYQEEREIKLVDNIIEWRRGNKSELQKGE